MNDLPSHRNPRTIPQPGYGGTGRLPVVEFEEFVARSVYRTVDAQN